MSLRVADAQVRSGPPIERERLAWDIIALLFSKDYKDSTLLALHFCRGGPRVLFPANGFKVPVTTPVKVLPACYCLRLLGQGCFAKVFRCHSSVPMLFA